MDTLLLSYNSPRSALLGDPAIPPSRRGTTVVNLARLAHHLQRERGTSSTWVASGRTLAAFGALLVDLFSVFAHSGVRLRSGFFGPAERALRAAGHAKQADAFAEAGREMRRRRLRADLDLCNCASRPGFACSPAQSSSARIAGRGRQLLASGERQ